MAKSLEEAIQKAGSPVKLLWESKTPPAVVPRVVQEFTNWRDEQMAWRRTAVLFDQSHHMADLNISGPDALKLISKLAVNSVANFPVDMAKQFVAVNHDGYVIGDNILFHLDKDEFQAVGIPPSINWLHYHAVTGGYNVRVWRDDNSLYRQGDPVLYRYQVQGPGAMNIIRDATGQEPPKLKFFHMTRFKIAGKDVRALRHGMSGEPGLELWGPWKDNDFVQAGLLEAGKKHGMVQVGGRAYHTNALESGWLPRPLPAIYSGEKMKPYREWLTENAYETTAPLGGSFHSNDIEDYYFTPYELDYGRIIGFDHDFIGRAALEKMVAEGTTTRRKKVTFVWNGDDVTKVFASQFTPGAERYKYIDLPLSNYASSSYDKVMKGGKVVGLSMFSGISYNEQSMLSLGIVDPDIKVGDQLTLVWGEENGGSKKSTVERHKQLDIRVTVGTVPYGQMARETYRPK